MELNMETKVIVLEQKGIEALAGIRGIETIYVEQGQDIPTSAKAAEILVVGPAEQQHEIDDALRLIKQLPHIKLLQTLGQGIEQWDGLLPQGLTLLTARGAHGGSTAELVVATALSLIRDLPQYMSNQKAHLWQGSRSRTLLNMKVLIYGAGDVGRNVQSRLKPFGAKVIMVGTHTKDDVIDTATAEGELPNADMVIMVLPLTNDTHHFVNAAFLAKLKDGAIVANGGRGGLIDNEALLRELHSGRLQAALDVVTPEPLRADDALWDMPGLLLTPHVGGNTVGADDRAWQMASRQITTFLAAQITS